MNRNCSGYSSRRKSAGFSLLEVLIALLVLAFGLLGFALLQTMNVRFVQSAGQRTQATNLASDLIEMMRVQRTATLNGGAYTSASFNAGDVAATASPCTWPVGADATAESKNIARWQCQVVKVLGDKASANVSVDDGLVTVGIGWGDERWDPDNADSITTFTLVTRL
ncbi:type IV pilus modification protein PilV [Stenotrophomonas sp. PFBMAA-4]|uniref:type IV pilus modification protein PilV n=1 Tax=Stenotrophomonas sp. PFBMAA-4 TaxID=3043301 RepID=UPI0024B5B3C8|nr:type IV pilus modification protein PilV [Stenotrophomonas sp. PFBMAA-4]MDI9274882.1 type IV pilus modification protein PilV [Stenotrophomonas sp. PFBMAA-4]